MNRRNFISTILVSSIAVMDPKFTLGSEISTSWKQTRIILRSEINEILKILSISSNDIFLLGRTLFFQMSNPNNVDYVEIVLFSKNWKKTQDDLVKNNVDTIPTIPPQNNFIEFSYKGIYFAVRNMTSKGKLYSTSSVKNLILYNSLFNYEAVAYDYKNHYLYDPYGIKKTNECKWISPSKMSLNTYDAIVGAINDSAIFDIRLGTHFWEHTDIILNKECYKFEATDISLRLLSTTDDFFQKCNRIYLNKVLDSLYVSSAFKFWSGVSIHDLMCYVTPTYDKLIRYNPKSLFLALSMNYLEMRNWRQTKNPTFSLTPSEIQKFADIPNRLIESLETRHLLKINSLLS